MHFPCQPYLVAGSKQTPDGRKMWLKLHSIPGVEVKGLVRLDKEEDDDSQLDAIMQLGGELVGTSKFLNIFSFDVQPGNNELKPAIKNKLSQLYSDKYNLIGLETLLLNGKNNMLIKEILKEGLSESLKRGIKSVKRGSGEDGNKASPAPALHLMPTAGINVQKFTGQKHDFAAEVTALYGQPILKKEGNTTYYIKQNRVVAKYDNILDKGFVYSKNKLKA